VAIDAKQRVILITKKDESTKFCAEPSPDALAAIGASLAASGQYRGEVEATLQAAIAESTRGFGVRVVVKHAEMGRMGIDSQTSIWELHCR
jgi:hypothetical protein